MEEYLNEEVASGWRVKLYELEMTGNWIDLGVGYVVVQIVTELGGPALCIVSEQEIDKYILVSKIQSEDLYEKQGETIILWKEYSQTLNIDYALSFQEALGCQDIWKTIIDVQGEYLQQREYGNVPSFGRTYRTNSIPANSVSLSSNGHSTHHDTVDGDTPDGQPGEALCSVGPSVYRILPNNFDAPTFLLQVKHKLDGLHPTQRDYVFAQLLDEEGEYLRQLFRLFIRLESELSDNSTKDPNETSAVLKELRLLADVLRQIVLLNDPTLIEYLLSDDVFKCVAGVFEYDRTLREQGQYRRFLFEQAHLVEVIPLQSDVRSTAKFLFRLKYLKDVMLHPAMDEPGVTAVTSMIVFTSCEICVKLLEDEEFCAALLEKIAPIKSNSIYNNTINNNNNSDMAVHTVTADSSDHCTSCSPKHNTNDNTQQENTKDTLSITAEEGSVRNDEDEENVAVLGSPTDIDGFILSDRSNNINGNSYISDTIGNDKRTGTVCAVDKRGFNAISLLQEAFSLCTFLSLDRRQELFGSFLQRHSVAFVAAMKRFFASHLFRSSRSTVPQVEIQEEMRATQQLSEVLMLLGTTDAQLLRRLLLSHSALCNINNSHSHSNNENSVNNNDISSRNKSNEKNKESGLHPPLPSFTTAEDTTDNDNIVSSDVVSGVVSRDTAESSEKENEKVDEDALQNTASGFSLLWLLVDLVVSGRDEVAIEQTCDTLRLCLDFDRENLLASLSQHGVPARTLSGRSGHTPFSPYINNNNNNNGIKGARDERDMFLQVFYDHYMIFLLAPFAGTHPVTQAVPETHYRSVVTHCCPQTKNVSRPGQTVSAMRVSRRCVLDLLCLCVSQHSYRTKYFLLRGNFLSKIISKSLSAAQPATQSVTDRHLQLQALRLLRQVLRLKDEFYLRHIARADLVSQVVRAFQIRNEHRRDTLLTASLAELLLYLSQESLVTVLVPLWQRHGETLLRDTLQGVGATLALQELYDTLRRAVSDCVAGDRDREHTLSLSSSDSKEDNFKNQLQPQSLAKNLNSTHSLLVLPMRARKENIRLREMSDEEEYFFGDDDQEDNNNFHSNIDHHKYNYDNSEDDNNENSYHVSSYGYDNNDNNCGENEEKNSNVSGMKRSVEDLYSDNESDDNNDDSKDSDIDSVSQSVVQETGVVSDKKAKLPRPSSPPHYSHVPPLSPHSISHHLLHPFGSTHSPNNQHINNNNNNTNMEAEDALQWLRQNYATSPPHDDDEENFVAKLAKRKQNNNNNNNNTNNNSTTTNGTCNPDKGHSNNNNNNSSINDVNSTDQSHHNNDNNDKNNSNNNSMKLSFSLKRPSVGHHNKFQ